MEFEVEERIRINNLITQNETQIEDNYNIVVKDNIAICKNNGNIELFLLEDVDYRKIYDTLNFKQNEEFKYKLNINGNNLRIYTFCSLRQKVSKIDKANI